jgi:hypothetical protein
MGSQDFIKKFISSRIIESNRVSCLVMAIDDARKATGRNLETGKHNGKIYMDGNDFINPYSFIGLINYLLILDLIGCVFKTKDIADNKPPIYNALKQFTEIKDDKSIFTIIALRNCLAHNYGLINVPDKDKHDDNSLHRFTIDNSEDADLINFPIKQPTRNQIYSQKSDEYQTQVCYIKLIDLIETTYCNLKSKFEKGEVELNLKNGIDELKARFTITN